jgi:hypothetical protein
MKAIYDKRLGACYIKSPRYPLSYVIVTLFEDALNIEQILTPAHIDINSFPYFTTINEITYYSNLYTSYSEKEMCEFSKREL